MNLLLHGSLPTASLILVTPSCCNLWRLFTTLFCHCWAAVCKPGGKHCTTMSGWGGHLDEFKVAILGAGGVGKSALTLRIISGTFTPNYTPTIEDYYRHETTVQGVGSCVVEILDSGGTEQFSSMRQLYISSSQGFAIVYAIDDKDSLAEARSIYQEIVELKPPGQAQVVLVGNKCDLKGSWREVSYQEGIQAARAMNGATFMETSAKENINVQDLFTRLVHLARDHAQEVGTRWEKEPRRSRSTSFTETLRRSFRLNRKRRVNSVDLSFSNGAAAQSTSQSTSTQTHQRRVRCSIM